MNRKNCKHKYAPGSEWGRKNRKSESKVRAWHKVEEKKQIDTMMELMKGLNYEF